MGKLRTAVMLLKMLPLLLKSLPNYWWCKGNLIRVPDVEQDHTAAMPS